MIWTVIAIVLAILFALALWRLIVVAKAFAQAINGWANDLTVMYAFSHAIATMIDNAWVDFAEMDSEDENYVALNWYISALTAVYEEAEELGMVKESE